ncbi:hypothetical protein BDF22DRAFT_421912 [Syncephalis plumigaleata]|nr:hypothetical protein BDF22DRAFT_421912 [Syncephalis plumigaleata]
MSRDNLHEDGYRSAPSTSTNTAATSRARITDESSSGSIVSTNSIGGGGDGGGGGGGTRRDRDSTETRRIRAPAGFGQLSEAPRTINTGPDANRDNQQQRSTTGANPQWPTLGNQPVIQQPKIDPSVKKWVEPLLDRFRSKFHNRTVKLVQLQMLLTDYFKHRITSKDFIDSVIQLTNDEFKQLTGKVVTAVIDQLENDNKRQELLTAWKDQQAVVSSVDDICIYVNRLSNLLITFIIKDKQFPDLQPSDFYTSSTLGRPGTGASSSTGAWNNAQSRKSGKQAAQTIEPDWGDSPSPWGKTAPTARYASASGGSAGPSALRSDSYRAKTTGSRTASDVVRNGMAPIVRKRDDDTADFPALPTVTRPPRPIVGKPVESEWLTGRPSATNASTGGNNTQPLKAKKGKGKGKTLLFHCG